MKHPLQILEHYWHFTSFRPLQETIINAVIDGEDTFALLPTGGGKSICFQIPALAKEGICIVISPLVALMTEQVASLKSKGIKAMALTSGITYNELDTLLDNCIYGNYKFLYLSPERLQQDIVQDRIRQMHVNLIAVDEAHCISQWGNDFRPAYKNIAILRQLQPTVNVIALTASATLNVIDDIVAELDFIQPKIFKTSFTRSNLAYIVLNEEDKLYRLETILKKYNAPSIVYLRSRKATIEIAQLLQQKGIHTTYYHGGLSNSEKKDNLNAWLNNQKQVMVATSAFGMGIDKPDVKTVIHLSLPESIESYFQEAGRAGRNGENAFAVLLTNSNDEPQVKQQFLNTLPTVDFIKIIYRKLSSYFQISYGEGEFSTFDFNLTHFCNTYNFNIILTYNALKILDRTSVINLSKEFNNQTTIQFIVPSYAIFNYLDKHPSYNIPVKTILRTYGGIFDQKTKINLHVISAKTNIKEEQLIAILQQLEKDTLITFAHAKTDAKITFLIPREDDKTINRIAETVNEQNKLKQKQIQAVLNYVSNNTTCKNVQLLTYFGEKNLENCKICSVCLNMNANENIVEIKQKIITQLHKTEATSRYLTEHLPFKEQPILKALQQLLEDKTITTTHTNSYKLT